MFVYPPQYYNNAGTLYLARDLSDYLLMDLR